LTIFTTKQKRKTDLEMKSEENLLFDGSNVSEFIQSFEDATNATVTRLFIGKLLEKESNVRKKQIEESLDEWRCVEVLQSFANKRDSHHLKADDC
jgi:predicted dinucleotide-utilizing enzyme